MVVQRESGGPADVAVRKLATMVGLGQAQLAAQLGEADANTTIAIGVMALDSAAILASAGVGYTASGFGDKWAGRSSAFVMAIVLLVYVVIRKSYKVGPKPDRFAAHSHSTGILSRPCRRTTR
jgi:hypothetical protein